jgi:hypothetical protein
VLQLSVKRASDVRLFTVEGEWSAQTAGGSHLQPTWCHNPQFQLTMLNGREGIACPWAGPNLRVAFSQTVAETVVVESFMMHEYVACCMLHLGTGAEHCGRCDVQEQTSFASVVLGCCCARALSVSAEYPV